MPAMSDEQEKPQLSPERLCEFREKSAKAKAYKDDEPQRDPNELVLYVRNKGAADALRDAQKRIEDARFDAHVSAPVEGGRCVNHCEHDPKWVGMTQDGLVCQKPLEGVSSFHREHFTSSTIIPCGHRCDFSRPAPQDVKVVFDPMV